MQISRVTYATPEFNLLAAFVLSKELNARYGGFWGKIREIEKGTFEPYHEFWI